jgi:hypothetical protein
MRINVKRGFFWGCGLAAGLLSTGGGAWAANTWERWEQSLNSSQARTLLQAYHDVLVEATYWRKSGASCTEPAACTNPTTCFKGQAFWDGNSGNPGRFMIRSAFPTGTWCWKTCLLPRNGSACAADSGLNQSGEVAVSPGPAPNALYSNGLPKAPATKRHLTYWNGQTPFPWIGDTAWNAPVNYTASGTIWPDYVAYRAANYSLDEFAGGGGFTNILVAPAVQTLADPPAGGFRGFIAPAGCGTGSKPVVPASCHYWDSVYWSDFDKMVKVANDRGIVIVIAGVMDPLNRAGSNQGISPPVLFPARADAAAFARNLAARLAGSFVMFSPSFDSKAGDATAETGVNVAALIDAVGTAIHSAAPRHLIGVHLAGGSALSAYDQFQGKPWLNLQVFQSGHGSASCEAGLTDDYAKFACRARDFALRFRCVGETSSSIPSCANSGAPTGQPKKPAVNIEGKYETPGDNETRVQCRHVAWNSGLSGSFGYDTGVWPDIPLWTNPTAYASPDHHSDEDLGRLKGLFRLMPWSGLIPRHDLLVEQNDFPATQCGGKPKADWLQLWKPHLALDFVSGYGLAYLPRPTRCTLSNNTSHNTSTSIALDRVKANALGISCATWTGMWVSPGSTDPEKDGFRDAVATCTDSGSGPVTFSVAKTKVACAEKCDRVLKLTRKTRSSQSSPNVSASGSTSK